jgi:hypothetical protein
MQRPERVRLELIVKDHALNSGAFASQFCFNLAHHSEQTRVVPHLRGLYAAGVIGLTAIVIRIAMVIEHGPSRRCDVDHVGHRAFAEVGHGSLVDQSLLLERAEVLIESGIGRVLFEIVRERNPILRGAFEQVDFRSTQVIHAAHVAYALALTSERQRQAVFPACIVTVA